MKSYQFSILASAIAIALNAVWPSLVFSFPDHTIGSFPTPNFSQTLSQRQDGGCSDLDRDRGRCYL